MATINSNMTRITGMASGLDIDSLVKTGLKPYQTKLDQKTQQKEVTEIKQKLYRDLLNDSKNFYNKYFDILGKDNLISSSNYKSVKFTPSSDAVSIVASSDSQQDNYKVTVNSVATAASAVIGGSPVANDKITVNGKEFTLAGTNQTEIAKDLTNQLAKAGIKVEARYTNFAGTTSNVSGLVLESTVLGKNGSFSVGTSFGTLTPNVSSDPLISNVGADATAAKVTGFNIQNVKDAGGNITVDYDGSGTGASVDLSLGLTGTETDDDILTIMNSKLDSTKVVATKDASGNITFSSTVKGASSPQFSIKIGSTTTTAPVGTDATTSVSTFSDADILNKKITVNGNQVDLTGITTEADLNALIQDKGLTAKINADNTITFTSAAKGASSAFTIAKAGGAAAGLTASSTKPGVDADVTIENLTKGGTYAVTGNKNTVTLDGSTFTFNDKTVAGIPVTITAKKDATELKDKIVKFIADYNTMIEKLNKTVMTKHTRGYDPLTADQKKDMKDDEIKLWNGKVETGQLYRDDDISRISNSMKESMRTLMSSTGLDLERIGIKPVKDYAGTKNGTFSIPDENALQTAIEENPEDVMDLFTRKAPTKAELDALPDETARIKRKDQTGIFIKLKNTIYSETMSSDSSLAKKVGLEGTGTFTSNTLTKSISDYEKKIKDMQKSLASREQALYSKYANLEKILNQYNAQQSSLKSSLGS
jgi:flagellar hook-associated protein 2